MQLSCDKEDISCAFRVDFIGFTFINHRHSFFCEHYTYSSLLYLHLTIISSQQLVEFHPNIINKQNFLEGWRHCLAISQICHADWTIRSRGTKFRHSIGRPEPTHIGQVNSEKTLTLTRFISTVIGSWALNHRSLNGPHPNLSNHAQYAAVRQVNGRVSGSQKCKKMHF